MRYSLFYRGIAKKHSMITFMSMGDLYMAEKSIKDKALELSQIMRDGKGEDVVVLDVAKLNSWTDFFIIVTVNSSAHWRGLQKVAMEYVKENDLQVHLTHRKMSDGDDWNLIDLGPIVIHLMTKEAREFYELEKLWYAAEKL